METETSGRDKVFYAVVEALEEGASKADVREAVRDAFQVYAEELALQAANLCNLRQDLPADKEF